MLFALGRVVKLNSIINTTRRLKGNRLDARFQHGFFAQSYHNVLRPAVRRTGKWSAGAETQERSRSVTQSPNRRRKHADHSVANDAARDERAFLRNGTGMVVTGDRADHQPVKWSKKARWSRRKQTSALLMLHNGFIDAQHDSLNVGFVFGRERMNFA